MNRRAIQAGEAYVTIGIRNRIQQGARKAQKDLDRLGQRMTAFGRVSAGVGLAVATPLAFATKKFADFDDAMRSVGAISRANEAELARLTDTAKELGRTTSFTAVEVASLMTELGRAGFDPAQIDAMTGSVLDLARATGTDAPAAASTMATAIRQFNLEAEDATAVADAFTAAANNSFNSVDTLAESLTYAGPVAADLGVSLEETLALLGTLGNVGIQGSNAGTAIRRLSTITAAEAGKLKKIFGVNFVDAAGNARPLIDTLDEVAQATNGLGTAVRAEKFNEAFGLLGITGASAISKTAAATRDLHKTIQDAGGIAQNTATKMDAGLGGSFRKMISAAEGVQIAIGESLEGPLSGLVDNLTASLGGVTAFIEKHQAMILGIAAGTGGLLALGGGLVAAGTAAQVAAFALGGLAAVFAAITSPIGLTVAAVGGLGFALVKHSEMGRQAVEFLKESFGPLLDTVMSTVDGITAAISNGDIDAAWEMTTELMELLWLDLTGGIQDAWAQAMNFVLNAGSSTTAAIGDLFVGLADFLGSVLDRYAAYYDSVFNFVTEKIGEAAGVRTIGGQAGSQFDRDFGDQRRGLESSLATVREFGGNLAAEARGQIERRDRGAIEAIADRQRRRRDIVSNLAAGTTEQTAARDERTAGDLLDAGLKKLSDLADAFKPTPGGGTEERGPAAVLAGEGGGLPNTPTAAGTFSAFGAALAGLGGGSAVDPMQERIAKADEDSAATLKRIEQTIGTPVREATAGAVNFAVDAAAGIAQGIGLQDFLNFGATAEPTKKEKDDGTEAIVKELRGIRKNTTSTLGTFGN